MPGEAEVAAAGCGGEGRETLERAGLRIELADWLRSVRLARAAEWLRTRDGSIESIARRAGYHSPSGFRAAYHRATGTSPSESRD